MGYTNKYFARRLADERNNQNFDVDVLTGGDILVTNPQILLPVKTHVRNVHVIFTKLTDQKTALESKTYAHADKLQNNIYHSALNPETNEREDT